MPTKNNVIHAQFLGTTKIKVRRGWRYDYGMILEFGGLELPPAFEVHFSSSRTAPAKTVIGTNNRVLIPDEYFVNSDVIYAWLYLHSGVDDGFTAYEVEILLSSRPNVTDEQPTPEEQSVIDQTIAALQSAVELSETNVEHYPMIVNNEWFVWDAESGVFVGTGVMAAGEQGQPGQPGQDGKDGYTPVKGVDYFDGKDGQDGVNGQDGYTPVKGIDYFDGKDGKDGAAGQDGYTPIKGVDYFDGADGQDGAAGESAYEVAVENGYTGTEQQWLASLKGDPGQDGQDGSNGADGVTFTPSVSSAGVISWTNDGQRQNPSSVDLVAAVISALPSAVGVSF